MYMDNRVVVSGWAKVGLGFFAAIYSRGREMLHLKLIFLHIGPLNLKELTTALNDKYLCMRGFLKGI